MIKKSLVIMVGAILLFSIVDSSNKAFGQRGRFGSIGEKTELVKDFDKNGDGWLNNEERNAARRFLSTQPNMEQGGFGSRRFRMSSSVREVIAPGPKLSPANVKSYAEDVPLYDLKTLRTIFLEFENDDWEAELEAFYQTDVDVPVKMTVDGKTYEKVGVRFRGNGSYIAAGRGQQRPLNLSVDFINNKQNLYGYHTLNLNTSNSITISPDQTYTRQVIFSYIARRYIPAPKANYIRLVINGESWGIYINYQQFNNDFIQDEFGTRGGARWKIPVGLGSGNALNYIGDNVESYKRYYEIKSPDDPNAWSALINLCKVLNQTPTNKLEKALEPILDIDGTLKFLAVENVLINNGGYWARGSDCVIYQDKDGRFHIIPYDTNESMMVLDPSMARVSNISGAGTVYLDPLAQANNSSKPLISRLLAVPSLRQRYLGYISDITKNWLTWDKIGPLAKQFQTLIAKDVKSDTHKVTPTEGFLTGLTEDTVPTITSGFGRRGISGSGNVISLKNFVQERAKYLTLYLRQVR